jgi:hypothetical protein
MALTKPLLAGAAALLFTIAAVFAQGGSGGGGGGGGGGGAGGAGSCAGGGPSSGGNSSGSNQPGASGTGPALNTPGTATTNPSSRTPASPNTTSNDPSNGAPRANPVPTPGNPAATTIPSNSNAGDPRSTPVPASGKPSGANTPGLGNSTARAPVGSPNTERGSLNRQNSPSASSTVTQSDSHPVFGVAQVGHPCGACNNQTAMRPGQRSDEKTAQRLSDPLLITTNKLVACSCSPWSADVLGSGSRTSGSRILVREQSGPADPRFFLAGGYAAKSMLASTQRMSVRCGICKNSAAGSRSRAAVCTL